ncbi:hypothetical protein AMECASPLE_032285 [Ameca splendens]|uniref:Uncharacterized protein n=1 Tax=Ameca splendens TaxID=208324 RepID=A0ABV0XVN3_9TELE
MDQASNPPPPFEVDVDLGFALFFLFLLCFFLLVTVFQSIKELNSPKVYLVFVKRPLSFRAELFEHIKVAMEVDKLKTRTKKLLTSRRRKQNKRKTDPDKERENPPDSPWDSAPSTHETPSKATKFENGCDSLSLLKDAVVVLTKLPEYKIGALRPPTPPQFYSEDESFSSSDSDTQWESEENSSDSDFWVINSKLKYSNSPNCDLIRMPTTSHNCNGISLCSRDKIRPDLPDEEIIVDMMVIARRRPMRWQRGKIVEIITKDDGRLKYKVSFEDKGTCLVSGHHIAFDSRPKVERLYIGARVVVRCQNNKYRFRPGVLAELPSRKNQFRFLMFMDDHTPVYVGLPLFHLVCRPCKFTAINI